MGDDDVVEGRMTLAEARETDFENHGRKALVFCSDSRMIVCQKTLYRGDYLVPPLQKTTFAMRERMPRIGAFWWLQRPNHPCSLHSYFYIPFIFAFTHCLSLSILSVT